MRPMLVAFALGLSATVAFAADQQILGNQLLVKNPSTPDKRSVIGRAKELTSPNTLVGDPTVDGATLTVRADGDNPTAQTFSLPQGSGLNGKPFWAGNVTSGFKYKDAKGEQGPVKFVQIKKTSSGVFLIKIKASGKFSTLSIVPPNSGTGGCMLLEVGNGDTYSVAFSAGTVSNNGDKLFKVKKPPTEGTCVIAPPTTTSTIESTTSTTESTTSTTESTTSTTESTTSTTESTTSTSTSSTSTSTSSTSTSSTSTSTSTTSTSTSTTSSSTSTTTTSTSTSTTTTTLGGPTPPPNVGGTGTITYGFSSGSAGDAGGLTTTFTCVDTTWTKLYWGSSSTALPQAALDGTLDPMSFSTFTSTVMTWTGTTSWTNPDTGTNYTGVPTKMTITITAGGLSWVSPPTGAPAGIGAAVKVVDPAGTCSSFAVKTEFFADIPTDGATGFIPLNTVLTAGGGTQSTFTGAFYWVAG